MYLAELTLVPGSESKSPVSLQVMRQRAAQQKMMALVQYISIAGRVSTVLVDISDLPKVPTGQICVSGN